MLFNHFNYYIDLNVKKHTDRKLVLSQKHKILRAKKEQN